MSGVPSGAAMLESSPASRQLGLGAAKFPEWRSRRADSIVISNLRTPRAPKLMVGRPLACLGPSVTSTRSAASRSLCFSVNGPKNGLPISSSPSKMNLRFTVGARPSSSMRARASRWLQMGPLSSEAPRAYTRQSVSASVGTRSKDTNAASSASPTLRKTGSKGEGWNHSLAGAGLVS